jgi:hypothetical protein
MLTTEHNLLCTRALDLKVKCSNATPIPPEIWYFAPFAILVLLFRLVSQVSFALFQRRRILDIEEQVNIRLETEAGMERDRPVPGKCLWYGHTLQESAARLTKRGAYAYLPWLWLQEALGLFATG